MSARSISHYLNHPDVEALALTDAEILAAVEARPASRRAAARRRSSRACTWCRRRTDPGHFNVLRGYIRPLGLAGVKVVGDFYRNYKRGLPSELALLNLFDPKTGVPVAIIDASRHHRHAHRRGHRASARKHLARKDSKVLGHIGARGTAYWNVRLLDSLFDFDEIRVHSRRPESRDAFAARLAHDLGKQDHRHRGLGVLRARRRHRRRGVAPGEARADAQDRVDQEGRLRHALRHDERGRALADRHHGQDGDGRLGPGARPARSARCAPTSTAASCRRRTLHAELGQIVAGLKPGRESDDETNLFWHRGLSLSDIALGAAMLEKAKRIGHRPAAALPLTVARLTHGRQRPHVLGHRRRKADWKQRARAGRSQRAGLDWQVIDYDAPAPLSGAVGARRPGRWR